MLRNIAIVAHVDHGKTTLVDNLLKQSGTVKGHQEIAERAMDSNDLEKERGITILAKCTSVLWRDHKINIVDTPGHADFGGEVERILGMVDGVILLVDAAEGPLPQTKFVLSKALNFKLKPIVVINKVDRADSRIDEVLEEIYELFLNLECENLEFPVLYASGRQGWASLTKDEQGVDLTPLFETILKSIPSPTLGKEAFQMLVSIREYDPYLGRILIGKIHSGTANTNMMVKALNLDDELVEQGRIAKLLTFRGLERVPVETANAGDIVALAGLQKASVTDSVMDLSQNIALKTDPIDPPTLAMVFGVNNSPLAGTEGTKLTSRVIQERLWREAEGNVAIKVTATPDKDAFEVSGRGELQLGILIETMRREGFELSISRPKVLMQDGQEPMEEVHIDVDEAFVGTVVESMSLRKGEMLEIKTYADKTRLIFLIPTRGLIGYHGFFLTQTRGTGVMHRIFHGYAPYKGVIEGRRNGVLIANGVGEAVAYSLNNLEERGVLFITAGTKVYQGMIIGENSRENDLEVNPLKGKQLTNVRAAGKDDAIKLTPPRVMSLEQSLAYIQDDELVEVTPKNIRLRKRFLDPNVRKKQN